MIAKLFAGTVAALCVAVAGLSFYYHGSDCPFQSHGDGSCSASAVVQPCCESPCSLTAAPPVSECEAKPGCCSEGKEVTPATKLAVSTDLSLQASPSEPEKK